VLKFREILNGYDELMQTLDDIPNRVQNRVFRLAGRKAGKAVAQKAMAYTPRRKVAGKDGLGHLADRFTSVQRVYRATNKTIFVVGSESGAKNRINHLVEFGTNNRWTGHRTRYVNRAVPGTITRNRRVKTASGGWKTVKETTRRRDKRISAGSLRKLNADGTLAHMAYRGRMPAYHQLKRAWDETPVDQIVVDNIRAGLQRIADKNAANGD
jgi:hypothetical protein